LLQCSKHCADFRSLLHVRLCADSPVSYVFVECRVTLPASLQVPVQIARDGEQVAFHRWLTDSFAGQPRGHKGIRSDLIRHHWITGEKQDESTNVGRVPLIKTLDVRHFFNRHSGYARTSEKLQGNFARVPATNTRVALSKQFQDLIEPPKMAFPPAFHE